MKWFKKESSNMRAALRIKTHRMPLGVVRDEQTELFEGDLFDTFLAHIKR